MEEAEASQEDLKRAIISIWREIVGAYRDKSDIDLRRAVFKKVATKSCVVNTKGRVSWSNTVDPDYIRY